MYILCCPLFNKINSEGRLRGRFWASGTTSHSENLEIWGLAWGAGIWMYPNCNEYVCFREGLCIFLIGVSVHLSQNVVLGQKTHMMIMCLIALAVSALASLLWKTSLLGESIVAVSFKSSSTPDCPVYCFPARDCMNILNPFSITLICHRCTSSCLSLMLISCSCPPSLPSCTCTSVCTAFITVLQKQLH